MSHQFTRYCIAGLLVLTCSQVHASLVGATIRGTLDFNDFNLGNCFDPSNASSCRPVGDTGPFAEYRQTDGSLNDPTSVVMDPDPSAVQPLNPLGIIPEFVFDESLYNVSVDVDASYLEVIVTNTSGSDPTEAPFGWTVVISDFLNTTNSIQILGLTPDTDNGSLFPGMTGSVINGGDAIQLFFQGRGGGFDAAILTAYTANGELRAGFGITTVPIPAAVWLFGSGLLGLVGMARRKKSA